MKNQMIGGSAQGQALQPTTGSGLGQVDPSFASPDPDEGASGSGFDIGRIIAAVFRYKWLVLAIVALGTIARVFGTRFLKPA